MQGMVYVHLSPCIHMASSTGRDVIGRLSGKDRNKDGLVVNLAIIGSSRFYDYSTVEEAIEEWTELEADPDMIILGGASGVDHLAERWADNNNIPLAVFTEEWGSPRAGLEDLGRAEADNSLAGKILDSATHVLAFPSPTSKWTRIIIEMAAELNIPTVVHEVE